MGHLIKAKMFCFFLFFLPNPEFLKLHTTLNSVDWDSNTEINCHCCGGKLFKGSMWVLRQGQYIKNKGSEKVGRTESQSNRSSFRTTTSQSVLDPFTQDVVQLNVEFPVGRSLAAAPRRSLFGHRRQHLADVGGQEVVHFVALARSSKVGFVCVWSPAGLRWNVELPFPLTLNLNICSPKRFHTAACCPGPGSRWWCGSTCCRCSSWRSWWRGEWSGCPGGNTTAIRLRFYAKTKSF